MRRFLEASVTLGLILLLVGGLLSLLGPDEDASGAAWKRQYPQCLVGKYAEGCPAIPESPSAGQAGQTIPTSTLDVAPSSRLQQTSMVQASSMATENRRTSYLYAGSRLAKLEGGTFEYFHADHLGTAAARTNPGSGIVERSRQLPFGTQMGPISTETYYAGKRVDAVSSLLYVSARYYAPAIGRFLSSDPVAQPDRSRIAYALNNPLLFVDPDGAAEKPTAARSTPLRFQIFPKTPPHTSLEKFLKSVPLTAPGNHVTPSDTLIVSVKDTAEEARALERLNRWLEGTIAAIPGYYKTFTDSLVINAGLDVSSPFGQSVIIHELTHFFQSPKTSPDKKKYGRVLTLIHEQRYPYEQPEFQTNIPQLFQEIDQYYEHWKLNEIEGFHNQIAWLGR